MDSGSLNTSALAGFLGACGVALALFALAAHPRFLARLFAGNQAGELSKGWRLRKGDCTADGSSRAGRMGEEENEGGEEEKEEG